MSRKYIVELLFLEKNEIENSVRTVGRE